MIKEFKFSFLSSFFFLDTRILYMLMPRSYWTMLRFVFTNMTIHCQIYSGTNNTDKGDEHNYLKRKICGDAERQGNISL